MPTSVPGFTPGGLATASIGSASFVAAQLRPIKLLAYTAGIKNRFAGGTVTLNLEGSYYDYENFRVASRNPVTFQNQIYNAEKSPIYGVQVDGRFAVTRNDTLTASVAPLHAVADRLVTPKVDYSGLDLPFSLAITMTGSYLHVFHLRNDAKIEAYATTHIPATAGASTRIPPARASARMQRWTPTLPIPHRKGASGCGCCAHVNVLLVANVRAMSR